MADPEAPTVTPSPALSYASFDCSSVPTSPAPDHPPPDPPTRALRRGTDVIQAEQTRCGICFSWLNGKHTPQTLNHLNACWKKPKARARAEKQDFLSRSPDLSTSPAEEEEGHFHEFDMPNIIPEDEEDTTESTSSSSNSIFAEPLSPWSPPHTRTATIPPNTYCILCWRDLSSLADLDAVQHRVMCLNEQTPLSCPICRGTFVVEQFGISAFRKPQDILKHLHECQNDGDVDDATGQAFENLLEAWRGRREMVIFLFNHCNGKKRGWSTSMHLGQYTTKRDRGRKRGGSEYKADVTPLRRRERILPHYDFVIGVEVEVEVWKKEWVPKGVPLDRFKRSAFHILAPKDLAQVPRNFKEQKVANETVGRADSIGFWGRLNLNRKPAPLSSRSHLAELREGSVADGGDSPLMKGTAAENFPAIGDRPSASFQLGPKLRHPPGIMHPTTSVDVFDAILGDNTPHPSPALNPTTKLSEGQKQPMKLFYTEKERADQLLLDTTPTAENTVEPASVTLPRAVKQLPQLAFTNTPDAPGDADQNTHSLPLPGRTFRDLDLPLYRPQVNFAPRPPRIMTTTPIRLPPTEDSAVQMPRCESLQKTSPLMLPSPYAHTLFFHDGSMIIFGDGVVPPSPNAVLETCASEAGQSQVTSTEASEQGKDEKEEKEEHEEEEEEEQTATSEPSLILPLSFPRTHHPGLNPSIFLNPSELDEQPHTETYDFPYRGAIPTSLPSNLRTVVDPRLSGAEQAERNRQCCMLNFGSVGDGMQMLSEEEELHEWDDAE